MTITEKIAAIRQYMHQLKLDAYIIPSTDPHQSEYIADHWQARRWATGFTGSAGTLVVTAEFAGLWTDSRYFVQAEEELEESDIRLMKLKVPHTPEYIDWLVATLQPSAVVGVDGRLVSTTLVRNIKNAFDLEDIRLKTDVDIISRVWVGRPSLPTGKVMEHETRYTGLTRAEKLDDIRSIMRKKGVDYHLLTSLDDIAWAFNIRGKDIEFNPLVICYALIAHHKATIFIDNQKLAHELQTAFRKDNISIAPYHAVGQIFSAISDEKSILLDPDRVNFSLRSKLSSSATVVEGITIPTLLKACKNEVEVAHIRQTMVKDGVAMVRFLKWLEETIGNELITEISAAEKLSGFRAGQEGFLGESFSTISAYRDHAALPHYSATEQSNVQIQTDSVYLVDSGGQYLGGTTDITRTITLGEPTSEEKVDFTYVLKGHIELDQAVFPVGTKGHQLDSFARMHLWKAGLDYGHGTGHGVGYFLNVHEGPQSISPRGNNTSYVGFQKGMVTSNEPGLYKVGRHGIRTENLVLSVSAGDGEFGEFLKFETLTLCPIDTKLIELDLLTEVEKKWLNNYHNLVFERLAPHLKEEEVVWLNKKTAQV